MLVGARDLARGEAAAKELVADGIKAEAIQLEVTDPASVQAAAARIEAEYGRLDVLVNNAAIIPEGDGRRHRNRRGRAARRVRDQRDRSGRRHPSAAPGTAQAPTPRGSSTCRTSLASCTLVGDPGVADVDPADAGLQLVQGGGQHGHRDARQRASRRPASWSTPPTRATARRTWAAGTRSARRPRARPSPYAWPPSALTVRPARSTRKKAVCPGDKPRNKSPWYPDE